MGLVVRSVLEVICCKLNYHTFQKANNKGADQTVQMRRLFCAFVVHMQLRFSFIKLKAHMKVKTTNLTSRYFSSYIGLVLIFFHILVLQEYKNLIESRFQLLEGNRCNALPINSYGQTQ